MHLCYKHLKYIHIYKSMSTFVSNYWRTKRISNATVAYLACASSMVLTTSSEKQLGLSRKCLIQSKPCTWHNTGCQNKICIWPIHAYTAIWKSIDNAYTALFYISSKSKLGILANIRTYKQCSHVLAMSGHMCSTMYLLILQRQYIPCT